MNYNDLTWLHFVKPAVAGVLSGAQIRRGSSGSPDVGAWVRFDLRIGMRDGTAWVDEARFQALGCPHVIAVSDWLAQRAVGREAGPNLPDSIPALRERFAVPVEKTGRLLLIEDAWIAAASSPYA